MRYREPTLWGQYRWEIIAALGLIVSLALVVAALLFERRRRHHAQTALEDRLRFETLLTEISAGFAHPPGGVLRQPDRTPRPATSVDEQVREGLRRIAEWLGAEGACLWQFSTSGASIAVSWTQEGFSPPPAQLSLDDCPFIWTRVIRGETLQFRSLDELPPDANVDRQSFLRHGVRSWVAVPLEVGGAGSRVNAGLTLRNGKAWPDDVVQRLRTVGEMFAGALARAQAEAALSESEARFRSMADTAPFLRRHADYFLAYTAAAEPGLIGARQGAWLDRIEREHDNLRVALHWFARHGAADGGLRLAAALRRFWRARGYLTEGRERMAELLLLPGARNRTVSRAKALHAAGWLASQQGDYAEARALFEESLAICRELGDARGSGWALVDLGFLTRYQGDYVAGRAILEEALTLLDPARDVEGMAAALGNLGMVARDQGDYDEAETRLEQSLVLWRDIGDRVGFGWTLTALGMVARAQGKRDLAARRLQESLDVWHEVGDRQNTANVLNTLAALARDEGHYETSRRRLSESLEILEDIGDRRGIAFVIEGFACLAAAEHQAARAVSLAAAAAALRRIIGAPPPPAWRLEVGRSIETSRAILSPDAVEKATVSGRAMTLPEAITLARG